MDITQLAASIIVDAHREAERIDNETHQSVTLFESETDRLLRDRRNKLVAEAQRRHDEEQRKEAARAERDARLAVLTKKRELIDETYAAAKERIAKMGIAQRRTFLVKALERTGKLMRIEAITPTKKDAAIVRSAAKRLGAKVRGAIEGNGGFLAHGNGGTVTVDMRFDAILDRARVASEADVAEILFVRTKEPVKRKAATKRRKSR